MKEWITTVVLLMNLWGSQHYSRSNFLALICELRIIHLVIWNLGGQRCLVPWLINRNLWNMRFLNNSRFLTMAYTCVTANSLKSLRGLWRVSWWTQDLICHVSIQKRWRRLHLICMRVLLPDARWLAKVIFTVWAFTRHTSKFLRLRVFSIFR